MDEAKADINCISSAGAITSGSTATGAKDVTTSSSSSASTSSSTSAADPEAEDSEKKQKFGKKVQLPIKQIISLDQLRQRFADTAMPPKEIEVIVNSPDSKRKTVKKLKHSLNEFYTFCTCPQCLEYREVILLLMDDQMKTRSTWEILQATLRKAYQPILKNAVSLAKYESFLASEGATWLTTGDVNHTKAQHLNFICDLSLTENMVSVLLSALLLVDDPHQLFELMTFQVECVVKAYWEGFSEIAKMQDKKIPAEEMLSYVLEGYDELCTVSDNISRFLFAFENHHLKKFSLTWTMLNKRMYQQHVYSNITNTMLACIITLKEDELTKKHSMLIKKYIQFDDEMIQMDRLWKDTWTALNQYNLSEEERNRRMRMKSIHDLFDVIRNDVTGTCSQCVDIAEWATHENRQLVWQSMLSYVVKNGADAYSVHLNTTVCDDKCRECNELLEYHMGSCKCVTCAIAGGPLPPKRHPDSTCVRCLTLSRAEKEGNLYESKILNVCASDDLFAYKSHNKRRTNSIEDLSDTSSLSLKDEVFNEPDELYEYHLSWAVFKHLRDRKPYVYSKIDEKYFCADCRLPSCLLAKKILNNEIALALSWHLIQHYQPLIMTHEDLTLMLKNIMQYNRKVIASKLRMDPHLDDEVFKIYWAFAVSVIACYFVEFDEETLLNLDYFELANNDIHLITSRLKGAEKDGKFFQFLDKISGIALFYYCRLSLSDKENKETNRTYESCSGSSSVTTSPDRIEHNVAEYLKGESSKLTENTEEVRTPESEPPEPVTPTESFHPKKCGKDKTKKCCFDHADMSDHCKENHSSKKRIKKECNHARMNETRDRLRKKLSQLVNARKNIKTPILRPPHQQPHCSKTLTPPELEEPSLADVKLDDDDDSLECLSTLCKRITHQPNKQIPSTSGNQSKKSVFHQSQQQAQPAQVQLSVQSQAPPPPPPPTVTIKKRSNSHQALSPNSGRQRANEFFALLENLPEVSVKKWVNETLSFIEGSNETKGPVNEKKAAKKAKQKQRKEEMKRIAELQDLRSQFHDIYFKEFAAKYELKILKLSKKKDKKKISDFEANIKKLNRAKAKVETNILELIATVKQTNGEFKFSYLPTKEQQIEKLQELTKEDDESAQQNQSNSPSTTPSPATEILPPAAALPPQENNLNGGAFYSIPYANANNFTPFAVPNFVSTPNVQMCYAPNQPTDMTDPSKRIVTIRRVNLPNVPEPQVTVTAKGSSPDKDKLLYTFVNGQIVQTGQTSQQQAQQQVQQQQQVHQPPSPPSPPVEVPQKTKTQLKKERKRAKKLAEAEEECERLAEEERLLKEEEAKREEELKRQEELKKQEQAAATKVSKKAIKKKAAATAATTKVENKAANKKPKKKATPAPSVTSSSQPTTRENSVCSQKVKPKPIAQVREKPPEEEKKEPKVSPERAVSKEKEKRQKFIDNGQFDNNQFKMLHLDDFVSSDSAESDVESEKECEVEKKVVPPKAKVVEKPQTITPVTTSTATATPAPATIPTNIPQKPVEAKPKPKPPQPANKVPQPEPVEKPSKEQLPPRRENKERNSRSAKPSPMPAPANHERNNERNRNKSNNIPNTRRPSMQIQSQNFVSSQHASQQQRDPLPEKPKRSRKSKNKLQGSIYQATPTVAPNANTKLRRNQSVIYSNSGSKIDPTNTLQQSMQNLRLTSNNYPQLPPQQQNNHHDRPERHHYSQQQSHSNVSIMDQLNRGVQVENLSLPPGITLTKVDPSKSEQLRAKSESIKKLSKPLSHATSASSNMSQPTIITSGFYPHMSTYGASDQNGVIMVEAMGGASKQTKQTFNNEVKVSKNRKRRNKKKSDNFKASSAAAQNRNSVGDTQSSPKMVTLRNPMFGNMMPQSTPSVMPLPNRLPIAPLPMDQPASIIKNENGMFTIRNPALQAAVANGLPVASYRQFTGNYYTPPQETIGSGVSGGGLGSGSLPGTTGLGGGSFSYFSNNASSANVANSQPVAVDPFSASNGYACDINDGSLRSNTTGKCISAIGSEVKTAQQLKQRSKESQQWQNFSTHDSTTSQDNACNYLGSSLQSNYYNGYDVFSSSSGGSQQLSSSGSLFENSDCPLHHNCEDSPPPTITGFNHYLDGIPNTGIIRYDDASFLKTLMPGQNLNNEVSIHNVNDSNFARNATSPVAHRVEITPVYGNRPTATSLFNNCSNPTQYSPTKGFQQHTHLGAVDFSENLFTPNTLLNLNDLDSGERDVEAFKRFSYDFEPPKEKQKVNININDLFMKSNRSGNSSRSSPFMEDSTLALDGFVQNLSALKLTDEQCSAVNGNINTGSSPNGWW